jgi:hypothetical protein
MGQGQTYTLGNPTVASSWKRSEVGSVGVTRLLWLLFSSLCTRAHTDRQTDTHTAVYM